MCSTLTTFTFYPTRESGVQESRINVELRLEECIGGLGPLGNTVALHAVKCACKYRGTLTYADLRKNEVQHRIKLAQVGERPGPREVVLVVWCFAGFVPFRQVDGMLTSFGQPPPEVQTAVVQKGGPAWERLKPALLKLLDMSDTVDHLTPQSALQRSARAGYGLVTLALVYAIDMLAHHEKARSLVDDMERIMELIGANVTSQDEELQSIMQAASQAVEQAALWLFRHGESTFARRTLLLHPNNKLKYHAAALDQTGTQLGAYIDETIAAKHHEEHLARLRLQFPVVPGSRVPTGEYKQLGDPGCLRGTRDLTLQELEHWLHDPEAPVFFLLEYCTGSGKSSVVEQLVSRHNVRDQVLATFRFKGVAEEHRDLKSLTLALARSFVDLVPSARKALEVRHSQYGGLPAHTAVSGV